MAVEESVVVCLSSEAQPAKERSAHAARQERIRFLIIYIWLARLAHTVNPCRQISAEGLRGWGRRRGYLVYDDLGGDHLVAVLCVIDGHGSARFHGLAGNRIAVLVDIGRGLCVRITN